MPIVFFVLRVGLVANRVGWLESPVGVNPYMGVANLHKARRRHGLDFLVRSESRVGMQCDIACEVLIVQDKLPTGEKHQRGKM